MIIAASSSIVAGSGIVSYRATCDERGIEKIPDGIAFRRRGL